jgi:hypothetical protein
MVCVVVNRVLVHFYIFEKKSPERRNLVNLKTWEQTQGTKLEK